MISSQKNLLAIKYVNINIFLSSWYNSFDFIPSVKPAVDLFTVVLPLGRLFYWAVDLT